MSVLAAEESKNQAQVAAMAQAIATATHSTAKANASTTFVVDSAVSNATSATQIKLNSMMKKGSGCSLD